ncbi:hypothetical protein Patl1_15134 [Pistacia atlantica]|uniref:Uncharacterized protein n=1 Tax=Pistacia atlantica TaxID=434234 RepID=A0ACC1BB56_9ROSI|nr:hypothetical protein Patl1_15134 [Pistacia atlantica]
MRREESLTFSTLLFSLFIFLIIIRDIQARKLQEVCSSSCGDIRNISFPFRLKGDPAGCGYIELSCESNKSILEFNSGKYYVKRISYNENTISLVDINLANGSCALPYNSPSSLVLDYEDMINLYSSDYSKARFLRCSRNISNPAYIRAPCLSGNGSHVYITFNVSLISDVPVSCSFISLVLIQNVSKFVNKTYPSYETTYKALQSGFDLKWSDKCADCAAVGRSCYYYSTGDFDCIEPKNSLSRNLLLALEYIYTFLLGPFLQSGSFAEYLKMLVDIDYLTYLIPHFLFGTIRELEFLFLLQYYD